MKKPITFIVMSLLLISMVSAAPNIINEGTTVIFDRDNFEINQCIRNSGTDMLEPWIIEYQRQSRYSTAPLSLFLSPEQTCDPASPENVHVEFTLSAGASECFDVSIPSVADGQAYDIWAVSVDECYFDDPACYSDTPPVGPQLCVGGNNAVSPYGRSGTKIADDIVASSACTPSWSCSPWSPCSSGTQSRTCSDASNCGVSSPNEVQSCTTSPGGNSMDGEWIGTPEISKQRVGLGETITITQDFKANEDGVYLLEAGVEKVSAFIPPLAFVQIVSNSCDPQDYWFANKQVALTTGTHTIEFEILPKQETGQHIVHTSLVAACGSGNFVNSINNDPVVVSAETNGGISVITNGDNEAAVAMLAFGGLIILLIALLLLKRMRRRR